MAEELQLTFLGNPEVRQDGVLLTDLRSRKAMALLCYLAVTGRPHLRPILVGLLWGEMPEDNARNNLSKALTHLRQVVGPHLRSTRQEVTFDRERPYWLDVEVFEQGASALADIKGVQRAVELYRGDFLEGFYVDQSPAFEEWVLAQRARLRELALQALHTLAVHHTQRGTAGNARAMEYATRLLALDPWREEAHRQLMLLLAHSGQRGAALAQYEACRDVLAEELGVEPGAQTTALYEEIRDGELEIPPVAPVVTVPPAPVPQRPSFLEEDAEADQLPVFVAREQEIEGLNGFLENALAGQGRVAFITGEAGSGKTALVQRFTRRAQERHGDLVVAIGNCHAYTGVGDPYLPFREILGELTGDVEARWAAGAISREGARRLWDAAPGVAQALVDQGPDLIGTFVPGKSLLERATAAASQDADWLHRLQGMLNREQADPGQMEQQDFFLQYTTVLKILAGLRPVILVLDDLQWADAASINLLFHLGRNLANSRILLVGAYRPDEVALGRPASGLGMTQRHPLEKVLAEFKSTLGDIWVNLDRSGRVAGREFVDALLDTEPNQLGAAFRQALHQHTGGHPMFTVELLRDMQERGSLILDDAGRWIEGGALDWSALPTRVEGVIEERIGRLEAELQKMLTVASVEGEGFTAQVIARVQEIAQRDLVRRLSRELDKKHRMVNERGTRRAGGRRLYRYRFRHNLFQQYLYNELGEIEREFLHEEVGTALEALYEGEIEEIVPQLARHFSEAGVAEKAVHYLLLAGDRARGLYAHQEAIEHYQQALALLKAEDDYDQAARTLMKLGLTYHNAFDFRQARQAYEEGFALWEWAGRVGPLDSLAPAAEALKVDWFQGVMTLDPIMAGDYSSTEIIDQLFIGLVSRGPAMEIIPDLAQSWEILDGGRRYVFHLRGGVCWSDGKEVTAADVEYAWKRALDPAIGSPEANMLYDVKGAQAFNQGELSNPDQVGVRARDRVTLVVDLEEPTGYFLQVLALPVTYPLPRHVVDAHGKRWTDVGNLVTNGPFRLEAWQRGESVVLVRNRAYQGPFRGNLQRVELSLVTDPAARLQMYESGDLDILFLWHLLPAGLDRARQRHAGEYVAGPFLHTLFVVFDATRPPFDEPRVRRALVQAINREALAHVLMRGTDFPATGGLVPPGMPGHSPEIGLPYDPDQARHLLAEAGYAVGGEPGLPVLNLLVPCGAEPIGDYLQAQWRERLGVQITWEALEWSAYFDRLDQAPPHLFLLGWSADYPDPDSFLRVSRRAARWTGWGNETYNALVEGARQSMDQEERIRLYRRADRLLVEEAALMPLTYGRLHLLLKPWVKRFPVSSNKLCFLEDVIIEPH